MIVSGGLQALIDSNGKTVDLAAVGTTGARTLATSVAANNGDVLVLAHSTTPGFCSGFGAVFCTAPQNRIETRHGGGSKLPTLRGSLPSARFDDNALQLGGAKPGFLALWREAGSTSSLRAPIVAMRFSSRGALVDPAGILLGDVARNRGLPAAIDFDGENWLVVWEDDDGLRGTLYARLIPATGAARALETPVTLTLTSESAHSPSLVQIAPGRFLLAYRDASPLGSNIVVRELITREQQPQRGRPTRH